MKARPGTQPGLGSGRQQQRQQRRRCVDSWTRRHPTWQVRSSGAQTGRVGTSWVTGDRPRYRPRGYRSRRSWSWLTPSPAGGCGAPNVGLSKSLLRLPARWSPDDPAAQPRRLGRSARPPRRRPGRRPWGRTGPWAAHGGGAGTDQRRPPRCIGQGRSSTMSCARSTSSSWS